MLVCVNYSVIMINLYDKEVALKRFLKQSPKNLILPEHLNVILHTIILLINMKNYTQLKNKHFINCRSKNIGIEICDCILLSGKIVKAEKIMFLYKRILRKK